MMTDEEVQDIEDRCSTPVEAAGILLVLYNWRKQRQTVAECHQEISPCVYTVR